MQELYQEPWVGLGPIQKLIPKRCSPAMKSFSYRQTSVPCELIPHVPDDVGNSLSRYERVVLVPIETGEEVKVEVCCSLSAPGMG